MIRLTGHRFPVPGSDEHVAHLDRAGDGAGRARTPSALRLRAGAHASDSAPVDQAEPSEAPPQS